MTKIITCAELRCLRLVVPDFSRRSWCVSHANGVIKITADCNDFISYTTETVEIKVKSSGEIVYSPTGDPALDTTLIKCAM